MSEIGEAKYREGHVSSIDWADIKAWMDVTGAQLNPGEASAVKWLSSVYVGQYYASLDSGCPPPHLEEVKPDLVENKIKTMFSMLRS